MVKDILCYIASPISKGDLLANIRQADDAFFCLMRHGVPAICPAWSCFADSAFRSNTSVFGVARTLPRDTTHADWLSVCLVTVRRCTALLRLPGESVGADLEVAEAEKFGVRVFHSVEEVIAWANA